MLEFNAVSKRFGGRTVVCDLSFCVKPGEVFGFLGGNGAGKTTSLRMLLGIIDPDAGRISVFGQMPGAFDRRRIGFLPEERGLYRTMSGIEAAAFAGELKGLGKREAIAQAQDLLDKFGLGVHAKKKIEEMSKGMAQKVQLAATLMDEPDLLVLDEPFSGLDPVNQELLEREIRAAAARGAGVIFSTHVMQHAERLCDRFLILDRGVKRFDGTMAQAQVVLPITIEGISDRPLYESATQQVIDCGRRPDGWWQWVIELSASTDPEDFLQFLIEAGYILRRFDIGKRSLHDIFVNLVGRTGEHR